MAVVWFILVLGIGVDESSVVGERVCAREQRNKEPMQAAVEGTWEVSVPVMFGVLTTIAALQMILLISFEKGKNWIQAESLIR